MVSYAQLKNTECKTINATTYETLAVFVDFRVLVREMQYVFQRQEILRCLELGYIALWPVLSRIKYMTCRL